MHCDLRGGFRVRGMKRFIVEDPGDKVSEYTDILHVRREGEPEYLRVGVWRSIVHGVATFACAECSGPLSAMLSGCPHAMAAKRAHQQRRIKKKTKP